MSTGGYLLDTNIVSALVRDPHGPVMERIAAVGEEAVATSIIVAAELRFGARKRGSERLTRQVEILLEVLDVHPFEPPADRHYARLRRQLERAGTPIGPNDMLIAAQALAEQRVLVTANEGEFRRFKGLEVENWLAEAPR
ncbi:type II toxin-antitoxin system VapC family toxin [Modicisalibacter tunisiensis]|uniref:Ribonuclease VapC n=1 Tax=Modicisalibacter tunisiensis TaxID=390637 RepID=A0ABS7WVF5_9GAMM|nr:type II toxin-antitoxin system VapC family toxin [Modicisalibacter tunisiensis]MBZ9566144.1 type II toxin-antitoxin system VapC family toxin [Modicisalibacter tunisiensis]